MKMSELEVGFWFFNWEEEGMESIGGGGSLYLWEEPIIFTTPRIFYLFVWKEMMFWLSRDRNWTSSHLIKSISPYFFQNINKIIKFKFSQKMIFIHFPNSSTSHSSMKIISFWPYILGTQISIIDLVCWWMLPSYPNASLLFSQAERDTVRFSFCCCLFVILLSLSWF